MEPLHDRRFGLILGAVTGAASAHAMWKGESAYILSAVSAFFFVVAIVFPLGLLPLNRMSHALVRRLLLVTNHLILGAAFVLFFIPAAMILRLAKKDPMGRHQSAESYWKPVFRQFDAGNFKDMF